MISQTNISAATSMGATLVAGGGATFRTWAPRASAVYVNGTFGGAQQVGQIDALLMAKDATGYWAGFVAQAQEGDLYHFFVTGPAGGTSGFKRDPYARQLATDAPFPTCSCIIRSGTAYPWHDAAFVTPDFTNMIIYQLHIGTYAITKPNTASTYLDIIGKIPYLAALGINVIQPLPVDETETYLPASRHTLTPPLVGNRCLPQRGKTRIVSRVDGPSGISARAPGETRRWLRPPLRSDSRPGLGRSARCLQNR